jgi:DNA-binding MarR family transcriptional regulator
VLGFMEDLRALEQGLNRRSKAMLNRQGVTGPQRLAVRVVGRLGSVRPAQLARLLHSHPSSVTRLVRTLEARGLIRRIADPRHRGRVLLEVGPKAGRVERLRAGTVESAVQEALDAASPRDVAATRRVLGLVTRRLVALK